MPSWGDSAPFDVEAKIGDDSLTAERSLSPGERGQLSKQMLQALLADRFKLRVHYESRIQSIDQLVVAKSGPKLKQ